MRVSLLSFLSMVVACSSARPEPVAPRSPAPPRKPPVVWSRFSEVQSWPSVGGPFVNAGHVGAGAQAFVRVSPAARPAYEHLVQDSELPDGAVVALFHELAPERPGAIYVMEKTAGIWQFSTYGADGTALEVATGTQAFLGGCPRCHADGVADSLFGPPRRALTP